jgi:hypothetical protein
MAMTTRACSLALFTAVLACAGPKASTPVFHTSDRCLACHNELKTASGQDVSIGFDWRASIMANSSRDPYWQASVRRETIDHPQAASHIEDECSVCHMPLTRLEAKAIGKLGQVFAHLPFASDKKQGREAADGVDCSLCHQISAAKLGTRESFNGGFAIEPRTWTNRRREYGPFKIDPGQVQIMRSSTGGFEPMEDGSNHLRQSEICATCHTLITTAFGPDSRPVGSLPEQMPYKEWLNSDFKDTKTCQDCHMTTVPEPAPITRVFGTPRDGMKRHVFVAANFFMQRMLNRYREEQEVSALPQELTAAADYTVSYLKSQAARLSIRNVDVQDGQMRADVLVENLSGHKLPTAYPSRRSWLHLTVHDADGRVVFESGALRQDGSIEGNDNDADPARFEPHYTEITSSAQVQIFEDILGDPTGRVTTGLLTAVRYLKDNRILPRGFEKRNRDSDIAVIGDALEDEKFTGGSATIRYNVNLGSARGPFKIDAELLYQPIGFRWANNLKSYSKAEEPRRFTRFYDSMTEFSAEVLSRAEVFR